MINRKVINSLDHAEAFNWSFFAFDTETTSLKQTVLEITGLSLCDGVNNYYLPLTEANRLEELNRFKDLVTICGHLIGHNIVFDLRVLAKYGVTFNHKVTKLFDTMVAHHLIDENSRHGLKFLTRELLNKEVEDYDEKLSHYSNKFYEYALDDSLNTWLLYKYLLPKLESQGCKDLMFKIEMPFQWVLLEMALEGVLIDVNKLKSFQKTLIKDLNQLTIEMLECLGIRYSVQISLNPSVEPVIVSKVNFNSSQQLIKIFNNLGLEITEKTTGGEPSVGKLTISKHKANPFVSLLNKYKIASKLYNAFISEDGQITSNLEADSKVRPYFNDVGTTTGRLSSSSPNCQQLAKPNKDYDVVNVRELFIAPEGYKMFSCDYSGQEVAVMAQLSKDPALVSSLNKGYDMHLAIANQFYVLGIPEEALSSSHPSYEAYKDKFSKERSTAKTITFGLAYGKGSFGFSKDFGISEDEAQKIVDDYFNGMPMLKKTIDYTHKVVGETGTVTTLAGRKRRFSLTKDTPFYLVEKAKRQSFNFCIQSFSADMIRSAAINVYRRKQKNPEYELKQIMTVHDENVYICKEEHVNEATTLVKKAFEDVCKKFVIPVNASIEIGENYGNAK